MTFARRVIATTLTLGSGSFGTDGSNTLKVSGLRTQVHVDKVVGPGMSLLTMRIHGMRQDDMNQISALNQGAEQQKQNTVLVEAGDEGNTLSTVFQGQILVAQQNLNGAPDVSMVITGAAGQIAAVQTTSPISYPGSANAADIMATIAAKAGWLFENNGVSVQLATPYYFGSPRDQARACAEAGQFFWMVDDGNGAHPQTLAIWPKNGYRLGAVPIISKATGMIGYPDYSTSQNGLKIRTLFNPNILNGGLVKIESDLLVANGTWRSFEISHTLDSETPNGQWMTEFSTSTL